MPPKQSNAHVNVRRGPPGVKGPFEIVVAADIPETPRKEGLPQASRVKPWHCQLVLALIQAAFCGGSVYLKSSLRNISALSPDAFHPIIYALAREAIAGPIMCAIAFAQTPILPRRADLLAILALGGCLFLNQLFYILGIDMSGVLVATCMQPTIPVFTAMIGVTLGLEPGSCQKFMGILLAVGGSVCMVVGGSQGSHHSSAESTHMVLGNLCLLGNTLAMAVYYLSAKQLVQRYSAMCVAAWAYITAAACMGLTAALFVPLPLWTVPSALFGPLAYWVIICSVLGYYVVTWAMQHLAASQVAAFQCVQPFFGTLLAFLVLGEEPSLWDLGAVGVIGGLALVSLDKSPAIMPSGSPDKQPGLSVRLWRGLRSGTLLRQNSSSPGPKR